MERVYATLYDEIVSERLYCGKIQLNRSLLGLVAEAESVLNLNSGFRKRTILRIDGGGGNDSDINYLLTQGYQLLVKVIPLEAGQEIGDDSCELAYRPQRPATTSGLDNISLCL